MIDCDELPNNGALIVGPSAGLAQERWTIKESAHPNSSNRWGSLAFLCFKPKHFCDNGNTLIAEASRLCETLLRRADRQDQAACNEERRAHLQPIGQRDGQSRILSASQLANFEFLRGWQFGWFGALGSIVGHVVHPRTYGMTPHLHCIKRPQHLGRRSNVSRSWIKPQVVVLGRKNGRHAAVNIRGELVRRCCQNCGGSPTSRPSEFAPPTGRTPHQDPYTHGRSRVLIIRR